MSDDSPSIPGPPSPSPTPEDELPEVRRRLWDLEWRLRRESGAMAEKFAGLFKELVETSGWGSQAIAEGLTPVLVDLRKRLSALEAIAKEGSAAQDPAFLALADRVEQLERLGDESAAAQHDAQVRLESHITELEDKTIELQAQARSAVEVAGQALGNLTDRIEQLAAEFAERWQTQSEAEGIRSAAFEAALGGLETRLVEQQQRQQEEAERLAAILAAAGDRHSALAERVTDAVHRLSQLEPGFERLEQELTQKVPLAQFASTSLTMASQQAALKELKAQVTALMAQGGSPGPSSS